MFLWLRKFLSLVLVSSTSLSMFFFFLFKQSDRKTLVFFVFFFGGGGPFYRFNIFFDIIQHFFLFVKSLLPACTIRVPGLFLTSSSTSSKMVSVVPTGKFFIFYAVQQWVTNYYNPWLFSWFLFLNCSFLYCVISIISTVIL